MHCGLPYIASDAMLVLYWVVLTDTNIRPNTTGINVFSDVTRDLHAAMQGLLTARLTKRK